MSAKIRALLIGPKKSGKTLGGVAVDLIITKRGSWSDLAWTGLAKF